MHTLHLNRNPWIVLNIDIYLCCAVFQNPTVYSEHNNNVTPIMIDCGLQVTPQNAPLQYFPTYKLNIMYI